MKYLFINAFVIFTFISSLGQSPCPLNGINGNPITTSPVPYNPSLSFKTNTFDWKSPTLQVNNPGYSTYNPITNFYNRPNLPYSQHIAKGSASDYNNADGWELIKRDFGYLANQNVNPVSAPGPYLVLYNKYSGILRILGALPNLGANQIINVRISFKDPVANNPNISNLKLSGLFNNYSVTAQSMDMPTSIRNVTTPAVFPGFDFEFFYADFQTSYDPCTCIFESALVVDFATVNKMDVKLSGNLLGINEPIANYQNGGTATLDQSHDYLSSVFRENNGSAASGMLMYKYIDALKSDYIKSLSHTNTSSNPNFLAELNSMIGNFNSGLNLLSLIIPGSAEAKAAFGTFETIGKFTNFFSGKFPSSSASSTSAKSAPTIIHAQMALTGVITDQRALPGAAFNFANPSCLNSNTKPEYNDGVAPRPVPPSVDYPIYNETLGVFSLLESPKISYSSEGEYHPMCSSNSTSYYPYQVLIKLAEPLKYAFNSSMNIDQSKTEIRAAFQYNPTYNIWGDNAVIDYGASYCDYYTRSLPINMERLEAVYNGFLSSPPPNFISPFLDLKYFSNFKAGMHEWESVTGFDDGESTEPYIPTMEFDKVYLKLIIKMVSNNLDANGQPIVHMLEYTYHIPSSNFTKVSDLSVSDFVEAPENISLKDKVFTSNTTIKAYKNIYLSGQITSQPGVTVTLIAGEQIITNSGATLNGTLLQNPNTPLISSGPNYNSQTTTQITTFCNSNNYLANISLRSSFSNDTTLTTGHVIKLRDTINTNKFFVSEPFPNPSKSNSFFNFIIDNQEKQKINIELHTSEGKLLKVISNNIIEKGSYPLKVKINDISAGIYYVAFNSTKEKIVKKIIVIK